MGVPAIAAVTPAHPAAESAPSPAPALFADGARCSFIGDSITHGGNFLPDVELFYLTRFPDRRIAFHNRGCEGDTAEGAVARYPWDIAPTRPSVAVVMFGMNDVGRWLYDPTKDAAENQRRQRPAIDAHETHMRALVSKLRADEAEVVILTPTPFDDTAALPEPNCPHLNDRLRECAERAQLVAREAGTAVVEFHAPMTRINRQRQALDPASTIIGPDRTHPGPSAHMLMAHLFLRAQHAPGEVAAVTLSARDGNIIAARRCRLTDVQAAGDRVSFRYLAQALPYPFDPVTAEAESWGAPRPDLSREILQVTDLPAGDYRLEIDGVAVGAFPAEALSAGVDLARLSNTPQYVQAESVRLRYSTRLSYIQKLRDLATAEHGNAPTLPHPVTVEQMRPYLRDGMKRAVGKPWEAYVTMKLTAYPEAKFHEEEWKAQAEAMMPALRAAAQPREHVFRVAPAK
jgi:endoglucanase